MTQAEGPLASQRGAGAGTASTIRVAGKADLAAIHTVLSGAALPTEGVAESLDTFLVGEQASSIVAVGGIEIHGGAAMLRSLAVVPEQRGRGWASALCDRLESEAARRGLASIYLLTETAERFFAGRGYTALSRSEAPQEIASSDEFAHVCPASATLMRWQGSNGG